jgi:hypothetical protein
MQKTRRLDRMASNARKYKLTSMGAMKWAEHELRHLGRIAAVEDPDIQYSYAMSTLNGMLHLKRALTELVGDSAYSMQQEDLRRTLDQVVRAIKHLIKDYSLDVNTILTFNTKKLLGDLANFKPAPSLTVPLVNTSMRNTRNARNARNTKNTRVNNRTTRTNTRNTRNTKKNNGFLGFFGL